MESKARSYSSREIVQEVLPEPRWPSESYSPLTSKAETQPSAESDAEFSLERGPQSAVTLERAPQTAAPVTIRRAVAAGGPSLTLAAVVSGDTTLEWGDAVAVVQQLIEQVITSDPGRELVDFPTIETIRLDASGTLYARFEKGGTRSLTASLGELLHQLSASIDRPPALRLVTMRAISATPPLSLAEFVAEVADWAPPDCRDRLVKLYQRARARELDRTLVPGQSRPRSVMPRLLAVAAVAVAGVAAVFGAFKVAKGFGGWQARQAHESSPVPAANPAAAPEVTPPVPQIASEWAQRAAAPEVTPPASQIASEAADTAAAPVATPPAPQIPLVPVAPIEKPSARDIVLVPEARIDPSRTNLARTDPPRSNQSGAERSGSAQARADRSPNNQSQDARAERLTRARPVSAPPPAPRPAERVVQRAAQPSPSVAEVKPGPAPAAGSEVSREAQKQTSPSGKAAVEEFQRARALLDQQAYARAAEGFQHVIDMLPSDESAGSDLRFVAAEYLALSRASLASLQSHLYVQGDPDVTEPVALGQFLPPPPDASLPKSRLAVLELIIDARGSVETARLLGDSPQYRTGWWVSAAKAWKFRPAMKDGNPVRFLKRIVVADSKPLEPR